MTDRKSKRLTDDPVSVSGTWYFTQQVNRENRSRIPEGCREFNFDQACGIDLDKIAGKKGKPKDECLIYREINLERETDLGFGIGADWWVEVYLSGEKIFSTFATGNKIHPISSDNHTFACKFRKGRNLLAVRTRRGSDSWEFQMKGIPYASVSQPPKNFAFNQSGYWPAARKVFTIDHPVNQGSFEIQTIGPDVKWKSVLTVDIVRSHGHYVGDFSAIRTPGDYRIVYREGNEVTASTNFTVQDHVYDTVIRQMLQYILWQRCGSNKGWAGCCHQDPVPLMHGTTDTGTRLDMRGGYHQSGDLRCWADGISMSMYALLRTAEEFHPLWDEGDFAAEVRWGLDYFLKLTRRDGMLYDCQFVPIGWGPRHYYDTPANVGAHWNVARLFARASAYFRNSDPAYADRLLDAAKRVKHYCETEPEFDNPYTPPIHDLPGGSQGANFYFQSVRGATAYFCGLCAVAIDLYRATGDKAYRAEAEDFARRIMTRQVISGPCAGVMRTLDDSPEPAFLDTGYVHFSGGMLVFGELLRNFPDAADAECWRETLARFVRFRIGQYEETLYDAIPRLEQSSDLNAGVLKPKISTSPTITACDVLQYLDAVELLGMDPVDCHLQEIADWCFGLNPEKCSFVTGVGFGHKNHQVFGQFFPSTPQIPGGVVCIMGGEYDMPTVAMQMWMLDRLGRYYQNEKK